MKVNVLIYKGENWCQNMYVCVQSFPITFYKFFKTILVFVHLQLDKKIYSYISNITYVLEKNEGGERKALLL